MPHGLDSTEPPRSVLAERMRGLTGSRTSGMRNLARRMQAEGVHVVNFAAGELDRDTSASIKDAVHRAIDAGHPQYTDTLGLPALRQRIAERISGRTGLAYGSDEVGFTAGAKQALFQTALAVFGPADEVIIPAPYWVTFPEQIRLAGTEPVFLSTQEHQFQIDVDALAQCITPRTRGIVLNSPHNPTGAVYSADALTGIARLALQHDLICIFDECYEALVYEPAEHRNIVSLVPEMKDRTVLIGSFSKTYCIAGWRAGTLAAPRSILQAVAALQSHSASNACNLVQYAALAALDPENDAFVAEVLDQLRVQRDIALQGISQVPHVQCVAPSGEFYLFPDVRDLLTRSWQGQLIDNVDRLAECLLEHAHIAVVPGSAFGADHHLRLSYAIDAKDIQRGLKGFRDFVNLLT